MNHDDAIKAIGDGALVFVSHSGGKDSQAMYAHLSTFVPADQIVVVHADLGEVEWDGVQDHIRSNIDHPLNVVHSVWKDGTSKTLLGMVQRRFETRPDAPSWPSAAYRQCTSDLKRNPIQKYMRHEMKRRGATLAINAMGLRAEESSARAKRFVFGLNAAMSKAGRTVYDWNPIHHWSTAEVFNCIRQFGQEPFHAYADGNERLSCVFCIMGCKGDLRNGARQRPELAAKYIKLERSTGYGVFGKDDTLEARLAGIPITIED
jgi:3'-phosphoadenosine 5'-phosphosulfate sulfotransferase (PAPS reductase)/FAD synthetase